MMVMAADTSTLVVTPLDGLGVDEKVMRRLNATLAQEVKGLEGYEAVHADRSCDGEVACLQALGKERSAARVLAGSVALLEDQLHIALKVVDVVGGAGEPKAVTDTAPLDLADTRLRASVLKLLAPDKLDKSGSIVIAGGLTGAEIVVDGVLRGTTPLFGPIDGLAIGRREVEVRHPDAKEPWRSFVDLRFAEPRVIELVLLDGALQEVVSSEVVSADRSLVIAGGVGAIAVGVALGVGAIIAYDQADTFYKRIHVANEVTTENIDAYGAYSALCGTLIVASVVAVGAGGGLVAFSMME